MHSLKAPSVRRTSTDRTERESRVSNLKHSQDNLKKSSSDRRSPLDSPPKGSPIFFAQNTTLKSPREWDGREALKKRGLARTEG